MQRKKFLNQKGDQVMNSRISQSGVNFSFFCYGKVILFKRYCFFGLFGYRLLSPMIL